MPTPTQSKARTCQQCGLKRQPQFFSTLRARKCRDCLKKNRRRNSKAARLSNTYGITITEYEALYEQQQGCCVTCGGWRKVLDVDHDHAKEKAGLPPRETVRGLICRSCNKTLAVVRDSASRLRALAAYLDDPPAPKFLRTL